MASDQVVIKVRPDGSTWHVDVADKRLFTLFTKEVAVTEAHVQAISTRPSQVIVYGADGSVEGQVAFPADAVEPDTAAASDRRGRKTGEGRARPGAGVVT